MQSNEQAVIVALFGREAFSLFTKELNGNNLKQAA
jgi:hypothetical protein